MLEGHPRVVFDACTYNPPLRNLGGSRGDCRPGCNVHDLSSDERRCGSRSSAWYGAATRELAIVYISQINGRRMRVCENLVFGIDGRVASTEVFHGLAT
jgi:hypothetical protein